MGNPLQHNLKKALSMSEFRASTPAQSLRPYSSRYQLVPLCALAWGISGSILSLSAQAAPTGHLGYLKGTRAIVSDARTGRETPLPNGNNVKDLILSPRGEALYFVPRPGQKLKPDDVPISNGMLASAPYKVARPLPGLSGIGFYSARWDRNGNTIYVSGKDYLGAYTPSVRRFQKLKALPDSQSSNGRILAFSNGGTISVRNTATGKEETLFSIKKPQPLFDAIKRAKNPAGVKELRNAIALDLAKDQYQWQLGPVALHPNGKRLYFASNAGTGMGAAGNAVWALFACDLMTRKLAVLSTTGVFFSRPPDVLEVSPDSKRLIVLSSAHSSAIDNACSLFIVDLLTQKSREVLQKQAPKTADTNFAGGACWSPDSKYVAFSALYYSTKDVMKRPNFDGNFDAKAWRLFVTEAATGKVVRVVNGATSPSWGR